VKRKNIENEKKKKEKRKKLGKAKPTFFMVLISGSYVQGCFE
jgi:hypothetical protein